MRKSPASKRWPFEKEGYEVTRYGDAHSFWLEFSSHRPDLILLDLMLPDGSGLDLLSKLCVLRKLMKILMS
jgi:DNA-binding response OmpR family regulator